MIAFTSSSNPYYRKNTKSTFDETNNEEPCPSPGAKVYYNDEFVGYAIGPVTIVRLPDEGTEAANDEAVDTELRPPNHVAFAGIGTRNLRSGFRGTVDPERDDFP